MTAEFVKAAIRTLAISYAAGLALFAAPAPAQVPPLEAPRACGADATVSAETTGGAYTTIVVCNPRAGKPEGEADWGAIRWDQGGNFRTREGVQYSSPRRGNVPGDPSPIARNGRWNNVHMTIKRGVTIRAGGLADMRGIFVDGAVQAKSVARATLIVEDGAIIDFNRTPSFWLTDDADRPSDGTELYYPTDRNALNHHSAVYADGSGYGPTSVTLDGVVNWNVRIRGSYSDWAGNGNAIWVDGFDAYPLAEGRTDHAVRISMGSESIIRHVAGSSGGNGIWAEQGQEDGDLIIDLAEGSLIDVTAGGGRGVAAWIKPEGNFHLDSAPDDEGDRYLAGDVIVNAHGTIRAGAGPGPRRTHNVTRGIGIQAINTGTGRIRVTSSGTIASAQGAAIDARVETHLKADRHNESIDDPATDEIEGHLIDVTGGEIEARGAAAIHARLATVGSAVTVRVGKGATVRARALTQEDYDNGAITQEQMGEDGSWLIHPRHNYGWREVEVERTGENGETTTVTRLEPIINAIAVKRYSGPSGGLVSTPAAAGATDRAIVNGTVETVGGGADDAVILLDSGGAVTVGPSGVVKTDTGLAIAAGMARPEEPGEDYETPESDLAVTVADGGTITGGIRVIDDGALTANVMAGGEIAGDISERGAGGLDVTVAGTVTGGVAGDGGGMHKVSVATGGVLTGDISGRGAGGLEVTVSGTVTGGVAGDGGGMHRVSVATGGVLTGDISERGAGGLEVTVSGTVAGGVAGDGGGMHRVSVASGGALTGDISERGAGDLDVTVAGTVTGGVAGGGGGMHKVSVAAGGALTGDISERGAGDLDVTVAGTVTGGVAGAGAGMHKIAVAPAGAVTGTVRLPAGAAATISGKAGRVLYDNGGAVTVNASGAITGLEIEGVREAIRSAAGDLAVTVHGTVTGNIEALGDGDLTVTVSEAGAVNGEIFGRGGGMHTIEIAEKARVLGTVHNPKSGTTISGAAGRVLFDDGGALTVAATGRIAGIGGEAIRADAGALDVTVASGGAVTGRIEGRGAGTMTVNVSGAVTGAIHGKGAGKHEVTVASGGMVTGDIVDLEAGDLAVSVAGRVTGSIEERGAGDLTATVTGAVTGGIRGMGAGSHTVAVQEGGSVAGAVRLPTGAMTIAGRVGSVLYDNGGSVTVAATGRIAGVERSGGVIEAIRSAAGDLTVDVAARATVTGDIRGEGDGDLDVDVSGTVKGGIFGLGGGEHDVHVKAGGAVEGLIHLEASTVRVDGSAGSVRFDSGGTIAVGSGGRIPGLDGSAVHSAAGDLTMTVNGAVTGSIIAGDGVMDRLTVASGGDFRGGVEGVEFIAVAGEARGTLRVPPGGSVSVPADGALMGAEDAQGRRVAIVADTGSLSLTVNGKVEGAVDAADAAAASTVTVGADGAVDGKIMLAGAGSEVTVDGAAQSVDAPRGAVTVGENGRIEEPVIGAETVTITAAADESDEEAVQRVGGGRIPAPITLKRAGADDTVVTTDDEGRLTLAAPGPAPRHRVYEALPSVLLALNALPARGDRLASAGAPRGAFMSLDAGGGERRPASSTAASRHDWRRFGFETGFEGAAGERGVFAISVHHVRGRADVETDGGRVEVAGTGARISGAWFPAGDFYVSGQAAATLYEADLDSALDGALARDVSGRGYAVGVEAGRRLDLGRVALTPRAGADWSMVEMSSFTDAMGERVSLDAGRRVAARAGLRAEAGGVFATADVERELSGSMRATAADTALAAEAEATWLRLGIGGAHEWADGRFVLRGAANYAAARRGNRDFTGSASFTVRF